MRCHSCDGKQFKRQAVTVKSRVGDLIVEDSSARAPVCESCGDWTLSSQELEKVELRAVIVAFNDTPSVTGSMLKSARKALGLTQAALADRLGTTPESISRWEREERAMDRWVALAVLGLVHARLHPRPPDVELKKAG